MAHDAAVAMMPVMAMTMVTVPPAVTVVMLHLLDQGPVRRRRERCCRRRNRTRETQHSYDETRTKKSTHLMLHRFWLRP
jgi:hypothetical protein